MANVSRKLELKENNCLMSETKHTVTEIKDIFIWLISRVNIAQERISELEDMSTNRTEHPRIM